jgi:large subunit ribosomal protein L25
MSTQTTLSALSRSGTGKGAARTLRRTGLVPAIVYGHGEETRACSVNRKELERVITTRGYESTLIELKLDDGKSQNVLIREVQIHPYRPEVLHVDFLAVHKGEKVKLEVAVRLLGEAPGVKEGGIMEHLRHEVEIRCIPSKIPEALEFDISELGIGDGVTVGDLTVLEDVEILTDSTATIASIVPPTVHKVEEPVEGLEEVEEEAAEPELVGRGKAAEDEEGAPQEEG